MAECGDVHSMKGRSTDDIESNVAGGRVDVVWEIELSAAQIEYW